jgi:pantoate--beta-alanine ligase
MKVTKTISDTRRELARVREEGRSVGFVPTMGYLHEGHLALLDYAAEETDFLVMSIFVNPMQFNVSADFEAYPRDEERDLQLARERGTGLVFIPEAEEMYQERLTYVDMELLTDHLCGSARPGHFRGVLTVVAKLFNIIQPDVAVFGQKDIQQATAITRMVYDLNVPVKVITAPTVREDDGLAMSSRNAYLSEDERKRAVVLYRALKKAEKMISDGQREVAPLRQAMEQVIASGGPNEIDYVSVVDYHNLQPVERIEGDSVIALAVFYGMARLIDNMVIIKQDGSFRCVY